MYAYRIKKEDWWNFAEKARQKFLTDHPMLDIIRVYWDGVHKLSLNDLEERKQLGFMEKIKSLAEDMETDIRILDEGETYLFEVFEHGYFFMNSSRDWKDVLTEVFYDGRSDEGDRNDSAYETALWVREQVEKHHYMIYPLVLESDMYTKEMRSGLKNK